MILLSVVTVINIAKSSDSLAADILALFGQPAFLSIVGSRIMLEMKEAGAKSVRQLTYNPMIGPGTNSVIGSIDFATMDSQGNSILSGVEIGREISVSEGRAGGTGSNHVE